MEENKIEKKQPTLIPTGKKAPKDPWLLFCEEWAEKFEKILKENQYREFERKIDYLCCVVEMQSVKIDRLTKIALAQRK